jgi:hypothetical protein
LKRKAERAFVSTLMRQRLPRTHTGKRGSVLNRRLCLIGGLCLNGFGQCFLFDFVIAYLSVAEAHKTEIVVSAITGIKSSMRLFQNRLFWNSLYDKPIFMRCQLVLGDRNHESAAGLENTVKLIRPSGLPAAFGLAAHERWLSERRSGTRALQERPKR